jgi:Tol biopolymer transport system component/DNA-binding winged helix-turn-helix (wHTH) protein
MHQRRHDSAPLRLGPYELDLRARELRKGGRAIRLQDKPFELLVALTERPREVVSREELRHRLWPSDTFVVFDDSLNTAVNKLREALRDSADAPRFIQTVPRRGYRYIGPIDGNGDAAPAQRVEAAASVEPTASVASPARSTARRRMLTAALIAVPAIALAATSWWAIARGRGEIRPDVVRFDIRPPASTHFPSGWSRVAVSPDGRQIVFCAVSRPSLTWQIWLQSLDSSVARPLPGTEDAADVAWSPDGRALAFRASNGTLKRYSLEERIAVDIAEAGRYAVGLAWSAANGILFAPGRGRGLARVMPEGGAVQDVSTLDPAREEVMHAWPQFLPDGRSFLYAAVSKRPEWSGLYLGRVGDPARRRVRSGPYRTTYVPPGFLVYGNGSTLVAQGFDVDRAALVGEPVEVASDVVAVETNGFVDFSVSAGGVLAHARRARMASRELIWVNRAGQRVGSVGGRDHYASLRLSPDGRWSALEAAGPQSENPAPELWLLDLASGVRSRITHNPGNDESGVWSPDSSQLAYARHPGIHRPAEIHVKDRAAPETDRPILEDGVLSKHPSDWSPDGRSILYSIVRPGATHDIWVLPLAGDRKPYEWLATPFNESEARFSPDGRWVAYQSNEAGRMDVFVRSFDRPGSRWQISPDGGSAPQWSADGKELYFVSAEHYLMVVAVRTRPLFQADAPRPLFELRRLVPNPQWSTPYGVSRDSQRFLIGATLDEGGDSRLGVVLNWTRLLSR